MREAKARLKEFWIKGKRINLLKHKAAIRKQVEKTIRREIKYISSFFPYNIEKFHNRSLLYFQSIFLMENYQENHEINDTAPEQKQYARKVMNLVVGLELLSIGTAFHDFKSSGSFLSPDDHSGEIEKEYTLDLLFGDIFYSRAVIYLLRFEDHDVFDRILASLKELHESRLILHRSIGDLLMEEGDLSNLEDHMDPEYLIRANGLLDISFDISFEIFCEKSARKGKNKFPGLLKQITILKTYGELLKYIQFLKMAPLAEKISSYFTSENNFTDRKLSDIISELDAGSFKSSIEGLLGSLDN